eukprot:1158334-Pelagomonas_calceolata.AAC.1
MCGGGQCGLPEPENAVGRFGDQRTQVNSLVHAKSLDASSCPGAHRKGRSAQQECAALLQVASALAHNWEDELHGAMQVCVFYVCDP